MTQIFVVEKYAIVEDATPFEKDAQVRDATLFWRCSPSKRATVSNLLKKLIIKVRPWGNCSCCFLKKSMWVIHTWLEQIARKKQVILFVCFFHLLCPRAKLSRHSLLICYFLKRDLSDWLSPCHPYKSATMSNSLRWLMPIERFAEVAYDIRTTGAIHSF